MAIEFKVVDLNTNVGNRSAVIKTETQRFLLKEMGIGTYGTEKIVRLFIMLPNGDRAVVQTICCTRMLEMERPTPDLFKASLLYGEYDCYISETTSFEKAIEHSINFITILYGN
jgi:hypothetical protein